MTPQRSTLNACTSRCRLSLFLTTFLQLFVCECARRRSDLAIRSVNHNGTHFLMHHARPGAERGYRKGGDELRRDRRRGEEEPLDAQAAAALLHAAAQLQRRRALRHNVHEADPKLRWKMVHNCNAPQIDETCLAYSVDGISWTAAVPSRLVRPAELPLPRFAQRFRTCCPRIATRTSGSRIRGTQLLHVSRRTSRPSRSTAFLDEGGSSSSSSGAGAARRAVSACRSRSTALDRKNERYEHVIYAQSRTLSRASTST